MAISVNYRGDVKAKEANATGQFQTIYISLHIYKFSFKLNATVQWLKTNNKVCFVDWCPTVFKVGLNDEPPAVLAEDDVSPSKRNIVMIGNNTAISRVFSERKSKKYYLMYSKKALVHR
eukprot:83013_1